MRPCAASLILAGLLAWPAATPAAPRRPAPKMVYLENDAVKIGMDLNLGGAVTHISAKEMGRPANLINSHDLGRQIQMSHYSGPWPFIAGNKHPSKNWAGLGWNPIQTGDCYHNPSKVLSHRKTGRELYIKCIPMQWPHNNVPGDCLFETWTTLAGPVIHMRFRLTNKRSDKTFYRPCPQELPAVYTISRLWKLMSYTGEKPFTGDALEHVRNDWRQGWPWTRFTATERWAALVGDDGWGLGVFKDDGGEFHGGIHGDGRSDDPKHGSTAYVAPIHRENLDHNIVYEHATALAVGPLAEIRRRFNAMATKTPPAWRFAKDRRHWTVRNATDGGFPLRGEWRIAFGEKRPRLTGPTFAWRAESAPVLELEVACKATAKARICWTRLDAPKMDHTKSMTVDLTPDGAFRTVRVKLSASSEYRGLITQLAIDPVEKPSPGGWIAFKSIVLTAAR
jgi:hypothetical protein